MAIDPTLRDALLAVSPATLSRVLTRHGVHAHAFRGLGASSSAAIAGPAYTLRLIPARDEAAGPLAEAVAAVPAGAVVVIDAAGTGAPLPFGPILAAHLAQAGAAGLVTDASLGETGLPAWSRTGPGEGGLAFADAGVPVACAGAAVHPDDVVVAGPEGAVVVPREIAEAVALEAVEQQRLDLWLQREAEKGTPLACLLPPDTEIRARFAAETGRN